MCREQFERNIRERNFQAKVNAAANRHYQDCCNAIYEINPYGKGFDGRKYRCFEGEADDIYFEVSRHWLFETGRLQR